MIEPRLSWSCHCRLYVAASGGVIDRLSWVWQVWRILGVLGALHDLPMSHYFDIINCEHVR